jgi:hypothetical protein
VIAQQHAVDLLQRGLQRGLKLGIVERLAARKPDQAAAPAGA